VESQACNFPVAENHRDFRGLGWCASVSGRQSLAFRPYRDGFRVPVSARYFPISVSAWRRQVRSLSETGSQGTRYQRPVRSYTILCTFNPCSETGGSDAMHRSRKTLDQNCQHGRPLISIWNGGGGIATAEVVLRAPLAARCPRSLIAFAMVQARP
jgi:hypothetical protein